MKIIESWVDQYANIYDPYPNIYAIVRHSKEDQKHYGIKEYEAMWMVDGELYSFGGSVGYRIADFDKLSEAKEFVRYLISRKDEFPDIWLDMVQASSL